MRDRAAARRAGAPRLPPGTRVYAIGDIHGRLDLFERLVRLIRADAAARPAARVRIILLGDIVDRGPDSAALIERCRAFAAGHDGFTVLKGNHEAMMVHALRGNFAALALWLRNGGDATLHSFGVAEDVLAGGPSAALLDAAREAVSPALIAWLDALQIMVEEGDYLFVHAGIRPGVAPAAQTAEDMLWIRGEFLQSEQTHSHVIVHGHSIETAVAMLPNRIGIDTGAYRTGVLTALGLEEARRWIVATPADDG